MKKKSIRKKVFLLTVAVSLASLLVVCAITISGMLYLRKNTVSVYSDLSFTVFGDSANAFDELIKSEALKLTEKRTELSDAKFTAWKNAVELISRSAEFISQSELQLFLENVADGTDNIAAAYIGTELGDFIITDGGSVPEGFDPRERPWYISAKETGGTVWTDVYEDATGRGLIITCAAPYYDKNGNFVGVAGVDAVLADLEFLVHEGTSWESETAFILNGKGETVLSGPIPEGAPWTDLWKFLSESEDEDFQNIAGKISEGLTEVDGIYYEDTRDGKYVMYVIAYSALETVPWKIVTLIDLDEVYAPIETMIGNINGLTESSVQNMNHIILMLVGAFALIITAVSVSVSLISRRFAHSLTEPIMVLKDSVADIAKGNLDRRIDIHTGDEIEDLGSSVNRMALDLKAYIHNLQTVTAEKERIGAELNVATKIQASMLPCIFPPFPDRSEFALYASMLPAKEVGGDFYDFFLIDDDRLAVVMADVSGKGVPAALFMVIAKTLIKNNAQLGKAPKETFEAVNNILCENNDANMFVTAFMGYLEISTGLFTYVNAGHNPPVICRKGGNCEWLPTKPGFVLAGMEDMRYRQDEIVLYGGDMIYLYTDGVTEAVNERLDLFTESKLLEACEQYKECELKELLLSVKREIDRFAGSAEQADDITMLAVKISEGGKTV